MAKGKAHSDETRAAAMAALLAGQGVCEVAREYRLDESTVRNWKRRMTEEEKARLTEVNAQKAAEIDGLLFDYLGANLRALRAQANVAADEPYLKRFPPQQIAVLHGILADKGIRLLEALQGEPGEGQEAAGD